MWFLRQFRAPVTTKMLSDLTEDGTKNHHSSVWYWLRVLERIGKVVRVRSSPKGTTWALAERMGET